MEYLKLILSAIYWIGIIRILIQLKEDSPLMYIMAPFVLGKRVGLGKLFWLLFGVVLALPIFLSDMDTEKVGIGKAAVTAYIAYQCMMTLYWVRVVSFLQKPLYLAFLQLLPIVNIWALWEIGSISSRGQSHGIVLQNDYETQLIQWMEESIGKGVSRLQIEEQLQEHNLPKDIFLGLYKKAVAQQREKNGEDFLS